MRTFAPSQEQERHPEECRSAIWDLTKHPRGIFCQVSVRIVVTSSSSIHVVLQPLPPCVPRVGVFAGINLHRIPSGWSGPLHVLDQVAEHVQLASEFHADGFLVGACGSAHVLGGDTFFGAGELLFNRAAQCMKFGEYRRMLNIPLLDAVLFGSFGISFFTFPAVVFA